MSNDDFMESFNVTVGNTMLEVPGRILKTPVIVYGEVWSLYLFSVICAVVTGCKN